MSTISEVGTHAFEECAAFGWNCSSHGRDHSQPREATIAMLLGIIRIKCFERTGNSGPDTLLGSANHSAKT
jgi:hypothetical protein